MNETPSGPGPERRTRSRKGPTNALWNGFFRTLRWIGGHVRGFYGAIGTFLVLGLAMVLVGIFLFAQLAEWMAAGATQRFDDRVLLWMNQHGTPWLDTMALEVTALGAGLVVWMVVLVASAFLWATRHRYSVLLLWVAVLGGGVLNTALKMSFDRPRPQLFEWKTAYAGLSSFPSGHSMTAVIVYGTLAYLVARLESKRLLRWLTLGVTALVVLLIGVSRMYLGVHYPSDVLAGFVAGTAWAVVCALGIEAIRYFRRREPEIEEKEKDLEKRIDLAEPEEPEGARPADIPRAAPG